MTEAAPDRPVGRRTLADRAYARILEELPPGRALGDVELFLVSELAAWLTMSRTPVREALQRLALVGILEPKGTRGFVRTLATPREIEEHFELRLLLEPCAARIAAARHIDVKALRNSASTRHRGPAGRAQLHVAIARMTDNAILAEIVTKLVDKVSGQHPGDVAPDDAVRLEAEHERILEALAVRNPDQAEVAMRQHLETARDLIVTLVRDRDRDRRSRWHQLPRLHQTEGQ